jgi:hypothetical protein
VQGTGSILKRSVCAEPRDLSIEYFATGVERLLMNSRCKRITTAIALFLIFSVAQVYVQVSFAGPNSKSVPTAGPQQFTAILTTRGNRPITINGASAVSGATILTGAVIETPDQVGATINLGSLGIVDLAPNTKLTLDFDQNGSLKLTLVQGCAIMHASKNTNGEVATSQGTAGTTDPATGGVLDICFPPGASSPSVNQGAAAAAQAGAGALASSAPAAAGGAVGGGGGLSEAAGVIIGAIGEGAMIAAVLILPCDRGNNPSPATNTQCR